MTTVLLILIDLILAVMNTPGMVKGNPVSWVAFVVCIGGAIYLAAVAIKHERRRQ